ncbi:MAG: hypothetical protein DCC88_03940 [Spirobacillus cienkowskii]|jgi:hypothetical protein|uniref:Lipoprotein n=1 Tax=Spirobacillus cienkowskii TaxID=495820 RepID=A0A369KST1_9BACT|nr:MAG: hypothetical protein DCC88_03940 [Spirobacillus cienkowskii]
MISIIFKKTNLLAASLLTILVVSCGEPYKYTPSSNNNPLHYPSDNNSSTIKSFIKASNKVKSILNENITILNELIPLLKSNETINRVSDRGNAQIVSKTISELELLKARFELMDTNNKTIRSLIPRVIKSMINNFSILNSETNAINLLETENKLFDIFNDTKVNALIGSSEVSNIKEKIFKLESIRTSFYTLDSYVQLFNNYANN